MSKKYKIAVLPGAGTVHNHSFDIAGFDSSVDFRIQNQQHHNKSLGLIDVQLQYRFEY